MRAQPQDQRPKQRNSQNAMAGLRKKAQLQQGPAEFPQTVQTHSHSGMCLLSFRNTFVGAWQFEDKFGDKNEQGEEHNGCRKYYMPPEILRSLCIDVRQFRAGPVEHIKIAMMESATAAVDFIGSIFSI